jgi:two-component system, NarL family, nitrate/nitrite response regulator NarL
MATGSASVPGTTHAAVAATVRHGGGDADNAALAPLPPHVYIISETRLFREGLAAMLSRDGRIDVIGHGPSTAALEEIGNLEPELVLLDMVGPDSLVIPRRLHMILPAARIVAVALVEREADVIACAEAGICAYVAQSGTVEDLVGAMMRSLNGELVCPPRITALLFGRVASLSTSRPLGASDEALTRREREIAGLMARGLQNKEIARCLCLGNATVKNHVHNILQKLRIQRRSEIFGRRFDIDTWRESPAVHSRGLQRSA